MRRGIQFSLVWVFAVASGFVWAGMNGALQPVAPDGVIVVAALD